MELDSSSRPRSPLIEAKKKTIPKTERFIQLLRPSYSGHRLRQNCFAAFNKMQMKKGEEWKTAFKTCYGLYEYLVMPVGLANAPSSFQNYINDTL